MSAAKDKSKKSGEDVDVPVPVVPVVPVADISARLSALMQAMEVRMEARQSQQMVDMEARFAASL